MIVKLNENEFWRVMMCIKLRCSHPGLSFLANLQRRQVDPHLSSYLIETLRDFPT
jgi:hypothetical protein